MGKDKSLLERFVEWDDPTTLAYINIIRKALQDEELLRKISRIFLEEYDEYKKRETTMNNETLDR